MSDLKCDLCKNPLKEPVALPCGYSICSQHVDQFQGVTCFLCQQIHHGPYQKNHKLSRLAILMNHSQTSCSRLQSASDTYNDLTTRPLDIINNHFNQIETEILAEKDRIVNHMTAQIDLQTNECLSQINSMRERSISCLQSVKTEPGNELTDVNTKIDEFKRILQWDKISENDLSQILQTCDQMNQAVSLLNRMI